MNAYKYYQNPPPIVVLFNSPLLPITKTIILERNKTNRNHR